MPRKGTQLSVAVRDRIDELLDNDQPPSGPAIFNEVRRAVEAGELPEPWPGQRSIQRYISQRGQRDGSRWSLATDQTGEPQAVLDALGAAIYFTKGRVTRVSHEEAAMIARIAKGTRRDADLPMMDLWRLAWVYVARRRRGDDTADLDAYLAFRPWHGKQWDAYEEATANGWIRPIPQALRMALVGGYNLGDLPGIAGQDNGGEAPVSNAVSSSE